MKLLILCIASCIALTQADIDWANAKPRHVNPWFVEQIFKTAPFQNRITGGQEAEEGQFPFQVALYLQLSDGTYFCGGTLISENYILTAAHCAQDALSITAVLGAHYITVAEPSQVQIVAESYYVHERYDNQSYINDIAVVKLSEPAPLSERIQLATLPSYSDASNSFAGNAAVASGWGQISDAISGISSVLRYVESNVIANLLCNIYYLGQIEDSHICLNGSDGKSTCSGDSGGPLLVQGKQVGVTSFGIILGCEAGWPAAFTRVTSYLEWIEANTDVVISE